MRLIQALLAPLLLAGALLASALPAQALGGHAYAQPAADLNFATTTYRDPTGSGINPFASDLTTSRSGATTWVPDSAGVYHSFAANTNRLTDLGIMWEPTAATNGIKNNQSTGAVAGVANTYTPPTGWIDWTAFPSGISTDLTLVTDNGLACRQWHMYGTAGSTLNTFVLGLGAVADIAASPGDFFLTSGVLKKVAGNIPSDLQIYFRNSYNQTSGPNTQLAFSGSPRLANTDTTMRRFVTEGLAAPTGTTREEPQLLIGKMNSGQKYDFTFEECGVQAEKVTSLTANITSIIATTNAAQTRGADVVAVGGSLLTALGGSAGTVEIDTYGLRGRRQDHDLLTVNSSVVMLRRALDGSTSAPGITGAPATGRGYRPNWAFDQQNLVEWQPGTVRVTSSGNATIASTSNSAPAITSATLGADGFVKELKVWTTYNPDLSRFTGPQVDVAVYGATSGGVAAAVAASRAGMRTVIVGGHHEICVGGMTGCGNLGQLDMAYTGAFNGIWIDWLKWADDQEGWSLTASGNCIGCLNVIPEPEDMHRAIERSLAEAKVTVLFSGGANSCAKTGTRIQSFTTTDSITVKARQFIDADYEGDLLPACAITSTSGREAADQTQNANGKYLDFDNGCLGSQGVSAMADSYGTHNFDVSVGPIAASELLTVDPLSTATNSATAPLYSVVADPVCTNFSADGQLQAFQFRWSATDTAAIRTPFSWTPSADYDYRHYELLARYELAMTQAGITTVACCGLSPSTTQTSITSIMKMSTVGKSPTGGINRGTIYDINSANAMSFDTFGANHGTWWASIQAACGNMSPAANYALAWGASHYAERDCFHTFQANFQEGYLYYLQTDAPLDQGALSATIAAGGSGCAVGERAFFTVANQDFPPVFKITTISGSAVTAGIFMGGSIAKGQALPSNPVTMTSASGTCTGLQLNITWGSRVPAQISTDANTLGYVYDYFTEPFAGDIAGVPYQLYVREGLRMVGEQVAHVGDLSGTDGNVLLNGTNVIGLASYAQDSHHTLRIAVNTGSGVYKTFNTGEFAVTASSTGAKGGMGSNISAPILLDYITPLRADATNFLATFPISATHAANSAIRMEGAHVTDSWAAGVAAAQAIAANDNEDIQDVDYTALRRKLETTNVQLRQRY